LTGRPASAGLSLGPIAALASGQASERTAGDPANERQALEAAIAAAINDIDDLTLKVDATAGQLLEFQSAMLADETLREPAIAAIAVGEPAHHAWVAALSAQIAEYAAAEDEYFRARASDVADIRDRVLRHLNGLGRGNGAVVRGAIIAAEDMTPSEFLETDWSAGGGLMLAAGSPTSHVAMLARSRGIPMVVGLGRLPIDGHTTALVDGDRGRIVLSPGEIERQAVVTRGKAVSAKRQAVLAVLSHPAVTADGVGITVLVNISGPEDLARIDISHCDGVGLFRTELMFREGEPLPDEEAQLHAYRACLAWAAGKPVTIRTLDVGGDKPITGLTPMGESNPFLGSRGIRLTLARPDVFRIQLRALARAAVEGNLKVMLPMVALPSELAAAARLLDDVIAELTRQGTPCRKPDLGIMVEVPAAAIVAESFADAAFFSIGSNDLTQYVMAASRDTPAVASLGEGAPEAVVRLIAEAVAAAGKLEIDVSLCGDLASDVAQLPRLLATGLRSLSVAPASLGEVKGALSRLMIGDDHGKS
jgi:phosphoenolpyruvate-protein phosphotransferase (PTS system enzyme I)